MYTKSKKNLTNTEINVCRSTKPLKARISNVAWIKIIQIDTSVCQHIMVRQLVNLFYSSSLRETHTKYAIAAITISDFLKSFVLITLKIT